MKRSRRAQYDKRRNRSKKSSERKFTFSNTSQSSTPKESIDRLKSFEVNDQQQKKYQHRQVRPKKKSNFSGFKVPLIVVLLLFIVRMVISFNSISSSNNTTSSPQKHREILEQIRANTKRSNTAKKIRVANFIVGKNKRLREVIQLKKDSTFPIVEHVNVRLFKGFHIYNPTTFPTTPIVAKFSKYYFFYDSVQKDNSQSMADQWFHIRSDFVARMYGSEFEFEDTKKYTFKGLQVEEKKFKILSGATELQGVATLVESGDKRYFFHFISKEKQGKYFNATYLRKYLNYYLKIR